MVLNTSVLAGKNNPNFCRNYQVRLTFGIMFLALSFYASAASPINTCDSLTLITDSVGGNERPRLYLTKQATTRLMSHLDKEPYLGFWRHVKALANRYAGADLPNENLKLDDNTIRTYGDRLPYLALAYLLTKDSRYLDGAIRWSGFVTGMKYWASDTDLGAAHIIFGLSIVYDWLYQDLPSTDRDSIRQAIIHHAGKLYQALPDGSIWWAQRHSFLQNHNYVNVMSIAVAAIALSGEYSGANDWLAAAELNFSAVAELLPKDGASHEGVAYWSYGLDALLKYYLATGRYKGYAQLTELQYLKNAPAYRLYMSSPGYGGIADYSDTAPKDYLGPGYQLRAIASAYCDPYSQWLADKIDQVRNDNKYSWLDLVWYDESIVPESPEFGHLFHYFENLGLLSTRSSWGEDASWFVYKGGMPQGRLAYQQGVYPGSHIHPDGGQFSLWSHGRQLIVDDGYVFRKRTDNHNVFLFNDTGQVGEGKRWYDRSDARRWKAAATVNDILMRDGYQYIESELADLYPPKARIRSWVRAVHSVGGELFVVEDTITPEQTTLAERMVHFSIQPQRTLQGYCAGGYYIQELFDTDVKSELSHYSVPATERNKDLGNYEGWLLTSKALVSGPEKWLLVMVPVGASCDDASVHIDLPSHKLEISVQLRRWIVDLADKSITVSPLAGGS